MRRTVAVAALIALTGCDGSETVPLDKSTSLYFARHCYKGVTYLNSSGRGITVMLDTDGRVVPCGK